MKHWAFSTFLLTAVSAAGVAHADDLLVMPFRCDLVGGKPALTPSDQEGHRLMGAREQRRVTSCSPVDPKRCRQWTVFKFDMECGGQRVSWIDVVANASEFTQRRTWLLNGQLRVQTTPPRDARLDNACAHSMGPEWDYGRASRYCADRFAVDSPAAVDMPPGFAPMIGLDGIFVADKAVGAPRVAATGTLPRAPSSGPAAAAKPQQPKAPEAHAAPVNEAKVAEAPKPVAAPQSQSSETHPATFNGAKVAEAPKPIAAPQPQTLAANPPANVPTAVSPAEQPVVLNVPPAPAVAPKPEARVIAPTAEPPLSKQVAEPPPVKVANAEIDAAPKASSEVQAVPVDIVQPARQTDQSNSTLFYAVAAIVSAGLIATLLLIGRFGRAQPSVATARDIGSIDLGAAQSAASALVVVSKPPSVPEPSPDRGISALQTSSVAAGVGDNIPTSKAEALGVLGMGVASGGNITSLKKIVDGLRMNWHPDLARDDADRRTRELRLKQINAAWEILGGRGAEA